MVKDFENRRESITLLSVFLLSKKLEEIDVEHHKANDAVNLNVYL